MKTVKNIYSRIATKENVLSVIQKSSKDKAINGSVRVVIDRQEFWVRPEDLKTAILILLGKI